MTRLFAVLAAMLLATPALAQDASPFAGWGADSGSLPPEYAWQYAVTFQDDRRVLVEYCKGYAQEAPGCATLTRRLSKADFTALQTALAPLAAGLAEAPPLADPDPPVGGGATWAWVNVEGEDVRLPAFPSEADLPRVNEVLSLLQAHTPKNLVETAERRAKAP